MDDESTELNEFFNTIAGMDGFTAEDVASLRRIAGGKEAVNLPAAFVAETHDAAASQLVAPQAQPESAVPAPQAGASAAESLDLRVKLQNMSIPEKVKLALFGNAVGRNLLLLDASRIVQLSVLRSPKLLPGEVENFSRNHNVSDLILREIARSRTWMKSYVVKINVVTNPKTPSDIALKWLRFLVKADLRKIAASKNLPQVVAVNARKMLADMERKRQ